MVPRARSISPQHRYDGGTPAEARGGRTLREMDNEIATLSIKTKLSKLLLLLLLHLLLFFLLLLSSSPDIRGSSRDSARSGTLIRVVGAKYHVESTTNEGTNECTYERMNQPTNRHQRLLLSLSCSLSHVVIVSLYRRFFSLAHSLSVSNSTPLLFLSRCFCSHSSRLALSACRRSRRISAR